MFKSHTTNTSSSENDEEADDLEQECVEESPSGRWNRLDRAISAQKLHDFDTAYVALDTEKGAEIAWNEMRFQKNAGTETPPAMNRFDSVKSLECIYAKLKHILDFLVNKFDHPNMLRFYDYWFVDTATEAKLVVITEYSSAGSLRKALESSRSSRVPVKARTYKRWLNQILNVFRCLHVQRVSLFQGSLSSDKIFIQNSGVIKLAPSLLSLSGVCERVVNSVPPRFTSSSSSDSNYMRLTNEIMKRDLLSIGRLALNIFTTHLNAPTQLNKALTPTSSMPSSPTVATAMRFPAEFQDLDATLETFEGDETQKDFVYKCFHAREDSLQEIDALWFHPLVNEIYSLKVLSVYSILCYFQERAPSSSSPSPPQQSSSPPKPSTLIPYSRRMSNLLRKRRNSTKENMNFAEIPRIVECMAPSEEEPASATTEVVGILKPSTNLNKAKSSSLISSSSSNNAVTFFEQHLHHRHHLTPATAAALDRRKVSLNFLSNANMNLPRDFYTILEDIKSGIYARLLAAFHFETNRKKSEQISTATCIDFMLMQQEQILRRHSSVSSLTSPPPAPAKKLLIEQRRVTSLECTVTRRDASLFELSLVLQFDDARWRRQLQATLPCDFLVEFHKEMKAAESDECLNHTANEEGSIASGEVPDELPTDFKVENICNHLTNELIDYGLIASDDHGLIASELFNTLKYDSDKIFTK